MVLEGLAVPVTYTKKAISCSIAKNAYKNGQTNPI